ncbi:DUF692 domain-containing protein [Xanthomonas sp. NCPPB 2654]|uniref:MNIO family bufferin maturase n=1 Tax=unclassified Xanthomonas TaxID=2643310 RepID=UPI0021DF4741|nr:MULTISPECIES: DUF692 domain-containing protein [unclassified Xanthomonas]MDL5367401.1 DUF692 domain-containing protein [Xanthomonas sp. NCPPB 2654]UYC20683.1 DUF692 domain-containing protein [Xanthomonas sp. CFBP 8443]
MQLGAGIGLKPQHYAQALDCPAPGLWFEVHPENYLVQGGPRLAWLEAIAARHPLSLHGVSLSLAADADPDARHLHRLAALAERVQPWQMSEHLAWSVWRGRYHPDLLPVPRSAAALVRVVSNVQRAQEALGRTLAIENPSHYLALPGHAWSEPDFLSELVRRSGCRLLLDINNAYVSAHNLGFDAYAYLDAFPADAVVEVHLAGHAEDAADQQALLIDSHDAPVDDAVWRLYAHFLDIAGPRPTLIERDGDVPAFDALLLERDRAQRLLERATTRRRCAA